jgi:hypothetical protein
MQELEACREQPELRQLVVEASRALARLDAGRLEELALSCQLLNRDLAASATEDRIRLARQAREAAGDMAVFARVLDVTRGNLNVINRLRELRAGRLEYSERPAAAGCGWSPAGSGHGDN